MTREIGDAVVGKHQGGEFRQVKKAARDRGQLVMRGIQFSQTAQRKERVRVCVLCVCARCVCVCVCA